MEDHNLADAASDGTLQKGDEPTPVEVDAGRNVFNDLEIWELDNKQLSLALDVFLLFLGGHSAEDDFGRGGCSLVVAMAAVPCA